MDRRRVVSGALLAGGVGLLGSLVAAALVVDAGAWRHSFHAPLLVVEFAALGALAATTGVYGAASDRRLSTRRAVALALVAAALSLPFVELLAPALRFGYEVGVAYEYITFAFLLTALLPVGIHLGRPDGSSLRPVATATVLVAGWHAVVLAAREVLRSGSSLSAETLGVVSGTVLGNVVALGFLVVADVPFGVPGLGGLLAVAPLVAGAFYGSVDALDPDGGEAGDAGAVRSERADGGSE